MEINPRYVKRNFLSPKKPGAYAALTGFLKNNPEYADKKEVEKVLSSLKTFTIHKPRFHKQKRRRVVVPGINTIHSADLISYEKYWHSNAGYRWVLLSVDLFSKFVRTLPLKRKSGDEVEKAFKKMYKSRNNIPKYMWVDAGTGSTQK